MQDDSEDSEKKRQRILAEQNGSNIGAVLGLAIGAAMALSQGKTQTEEQAIQDEQDFNEFLAHMAAEEEEHIWQQMMYEAEQDALKETISAYEKLQESHSEAVENIERHIQLVEQYTDLKELDARILNRLIEKILVHQRGVDEDGCPMQMIEIYYRFIGKTEIDLYDLFCPAA